MLLFDETATTGIYTYCHTLSLHDALPSSRCSRHSGRRRWQTHCLAPNPHAGSSVMRSDISHLPVKNQRELEQIVRAIFEEFEDAHKLASGERKAGRILKVILYGSIARGEGIYEPETAKGYVSDYDILVIVNQDELAETEHWTHLEDRFSREHVILGRLRHPVDRKSTRLNSSHSCASRMPSS